MGPCADLITADDVLDCCTASQFDEHYPPSDETLAYAVEVASGVAWRLAGRRHGACEVTAERPGRLRRRNRCTAPYRTDAGWVNGCRCNPAATITLAGTPVIAVSAVYVAGVALAQTDYVLLPPNRLVRRDGGVWPACQLLEYPDDGAGVVTVDYTWGIPLDTHGVRAVSAFACELVKACTGQKSCRLPQRVQSITRQGISMAILDPFDFLDNGRTGVYQFDLWLATVNPTGMPRRSRVFSPDIARPVTPAQQGT